MGEPTGQGRSRAGWWLVLPALAVVYLVAALGLPFREEARWGGRCPWGDWEGALAEASEAATQGQAGIALRCAYRAFLDAEVAGAGAALVRVGDLLQNMGVQRYLKMTVRSAYLRAAEHARRAQEWPVMAAAATRLLAMGEVGEASVLLAEVCSRTDAGGAGVPCEPLRVAASPTLLSEE